MKRRKGAQTRILCLIDGYQSVFGGELDAGSKQANASRMEREMRARPGQWFLVGQSGKSGGVFTRIGARASDLRGRGFEAVEIDGKHLARVPHKSGVPIESLVTRRKPPTAADALPSVKSDRFGWSRDELNNATATAKAWLFPIEGIAV